MARLRRANCSRKHALREIDDGPILHRKDLTRLPDYWEEDEDGDLQPVFIPKLPDPLFTREELKPYRSNPALFLHKQSLRKLDGPPFHFLELPTELRFEVYRYCLVAHTSIRPYRCKENSCSYSLRLTVSLLRTCKAMHAECAQVLYGENEFSFPDAYDQLKLLKFLKQIGPTHRMWLRDLAMSVPFLDTENSDVWRCKTNLVMRWAGSSAHHNIGYYEHICPELSTRSGYQHSKITWSGLCKSLFHLLASLPQFRKWTLILPWNWVYNNCYKSSRPRIGMFYRNDEDVWALLSDLLHTKPFLEVIVVRPKNPEWWLQNHERHLANLKRRLGIWDHRIAYYEDGWSLPDAVEEDPDECIRDLRFLFV